MRRHQELQIGGNPVAIGQMLEMGVVMKMEHARPRSRATSMPIGAADDEMGDGKHPF